MGAVALDAVVARAEQLQVFQVVGAAARAGHAVVDLEQLEREVALAAVAEALRLAEQDVLFLAVGNGASMSAWRGMSVRAVS